MKQAIGGYFELELRSGKHYHTQAICLNTARNCLEYIVCARKYKKIYIPDYTCEVILEPLKKLHVEYEFYHINMRLEPQCLISLRSDEAFLYTNYFGLKQNYVNELANIYGTQLIIDNSQAFFARPVPHIDTFYSTRKFFGVSDGAYLYTECFLDQHIPQDHSVERMFHLLQRIDESAEDGYNSYKTTERLLDGQPIMKMSKLTEKILRSIDYNRVQEIRRDNFVKLAGILDRTNLLHITLDPDAVPMVYPYYSRQDKLRKQLIDHKIFVATYWQNVFQWVEEETCAYQLARFLIPLPIDQRYGETEMRMIINEISH